MIAMDSNRQGQNSNESLFGLFSEMRQLRLSIGVNFFEYVESMPTIATDPRGTFPYFLRLPVRAASDPAGRPCRWENRFRRLQMHRHAYQRICGH